MFLLKNCLFLQRKIKKLLKDEEITVLSDGSAGGSISLSL